jgi:hypothetical protein
MPKPETPKGRPTSQGRQSKTRIIAPNRVLSPHPANFSDTVHTAFGRLVDLLLSSKHFSKQPVTRSHLNLLFLHFFTTMRRVIIAVLFSISSSFAAICYSTAGQVLDPTSYFPCDNTTVFSSCCLLYQQNGGPGDVCTSAGLCLRQDTMPGFFYQDGCTDKSWASTYCPKFCMSESSLLTDWNNSL